MIFIFLIFISCKQIPYSTSTHTLTSLSYRTIRQRNHISPLIFLIYVLILILITLELNCTSHLHHVYFRRHCLTNLVTLTVLPMTYFVNYKLRLSGKNKQTYACNSLNESCCCIGQRLHRFNYRYFTFQARTSVDMIPIKFCRIIYTREHVHYVNKLFDLLSISFISFLAYFYQNILSNEIKINSGDFVYRFFSFCKSNSLAKDDFHRVKLLEGHNVLSDYNIISLCETSLHGSVELPDVVIDNYTFVKRAYMGPWNYLMW